MQTLELRVVHGSLEHAAHPVAVGHYQGMPLDGAEGAVDRCLGGILGERQLLGAYPEQEGSAIAVRGTPDSMPPGALVLGLGVAGEVTAAKVAQAMTQATILRALAALDEPEAEKPRAVGISAVLVGANPLDGISVERSLAALVEGVVAAVHALQAGPTVSSAVRIGTLEVVERYEARAEAAFRGLDSLATLIGAHGGIELRPAAALVRGEGGVDGQPPADYSAGAWLRLDVRALPGGTKDGFRRLELTSAARRARADRLEQILESATVDGLVAASVGRTHPDPQVANTLYELLLPAELKADLLAADNVHLLLEPETAGYPWEALAPRDGDDALAPLALRAGVLRQFADPDIRNARFAVRRAAGLHALVIGNPPAGDAPDLPGAAREAQRVATLLGHVKGDGPPFTVHSLTWSDDEAQAVGLPAVDDAETWEHVLNALYRYEYRIVHIAAHGAFDPSHPARSGVLVGDGRFLTAQTVAQLGAVPELVFLNCCHSGRVDDAPHATRRHGSANLLAASVARALMALGVRAVVAAGWAVDDDGAIAFATAFYEQLLERGTAFGDAVHAARRSAHDASDSMTWAAYQCYGDPEFRLRAAAPA